MSNYPHEILAKVDRLSEEQKSLLAEIQSSRDSKSQPIQTLKAFGGKPETGPFKSMGHFLHCVKTAGPNVNSNPEIQGWHKAWQEHASRSWQAQGMKTMPTGLNESVGADGGVLVPPVWANQIMMRTYGNDILGRTTLFPLTTGNNLRVPAVLETSRANGSRFGGVAGYWRGEAGTIAAAKPQLELIDLNLESLTVAIQATQELIDDASSLESFINMVAPAELSFKIGDAIVNGDGVGKPVGLLKSPSKVVVSKQVGQPGQTITAHNVNEMWSRLHVSCRDNAVWLYDQSIEPALDEMTIGTASAQMPVYLPPGGLSAGRYGTIKGRPAIPVEFCQQLGTEGDLILTDLSTYLTASKGGVQSAVSMHVYFLTNEQVFRWVVRLAGRSWWISALTPASGGPTQSNLVVLATRA